MGLEDMILESLKPEVNQMVKECLEKQGGVGRTVQVVNNKRNRHSKCSRAKRRYI